MKCSCSLGWHRLCVTCLPPEQDVPSCLSCLLLAHPLWVLAGCQGMRALEEMPISAAGHGLQQQRVSFTLSASTAHSSAPCELSQELPMLLWLLGLSSARARQKTKQGLVLRRRAQEQTPSCNGWVLMMDEEGSKYPLERGGVWICAICASSPSRLPVQKAGRVCCGISRHAVEMFSFPFVCKLAACAHAVWLRLIRGIATSYPCCLTSRPAVVEAGLLWAVVTPASQGGWGCAGVWAHATWL